MNIKDPEEYKVTATALADKDIVEIFIDKNLAYKQRGLPGLSSTTNPVWSLTKDAYKAYQHINKIFTGTVADSVSCGDLIWIHDYQLLLFPGYLQGQLETHALPRAGFLENASRAERAVSWSVVYDLIRLHMDK
ncbi:hypothetical protein ASPSYDRAFT_27346 [Aspergillus sydowii CBS 593.65]|uniref:Uncharacterized protein n=1 Tax=Aspergillus sydowii CBS 593.65 TaxID=1036612 RepID=A0A1L9U168_9EURO|nr:uncharacterized protein ASPSYDRAFT_27346 [Aspergillus sydowii CBS 593.65]OJJ65409.1 hypothetical protein ASPSYDRAFT_27346 [Aspergillus sydowii CBS 593.65]